MTIRREEGHSFSKPTSDPAFVAAFEVEKDARDAEVASALL